MTGAETIDPDDIGKNGTSPFTVATDPPDSTIAGAPDCSNPNWTESIDDLAFTSATITVEQPPGTVVLVVECDFDPATDDGIVPDNTVSCTST